MAENFEYKHYRNFPKKDWRWKDFTPREMSSKGKDGAKLMVNYESMDLLQELRNLLKKPMIVNSAYRSAEHNKEVGSMPTSQHRLARAFDISMNNQNPLHFEAAARAVGFTGFGYYPKGNFIHIDTGRYRQWGERWFAAPTVTLPKTFPPEVKPVEAVKGKGNKVAITGVVALVAAVGVWWDQIISWLGGLFQ